MVSLCDSEGLYFKLPDWPIFLYSIRDQTINRACSNIEICPLEHKQVICHICFALQ